jgi:hypothetical protein
MAAFDKIVIVGKLSVHLAHQNRCFPDELKYVPCRMSWPAVGAPPVLTTYST